MWDIDGGTAFKIDIENMKYAAESNLEAVTIDSTFYFSKIANSPPSIWFKYENKTKTKKNLTTNHA
jgi:hypothetical protein